MQANDSIICEYFCVAFIDFMLENKNLLDSPNECEKSDKMMLKYFQ